ncbi:hypothetical protein ACRARG_12515 [Pseudooceanicola sp. C21-150M6]|uniref:hypothetical protein n=1 Tax=Pseudooceanicola sp. C21-150M6 TaxID=3434355 RepID=UPI003D7F71A4
MAFQISPENFTPEQIAATCAGIAGIIGVILTAAKRSAKKVEEPKDKADLLMQQQASFDRRLAALEVGQKQLAQDHVRLLEEEEETRAEVRKASDRLVRIEDRTVRR